MLTEANRLADELEDLIADKRVLKEDPETYQFTSESMQLVIDSLRAWQVHERQQRMADDKVERAHARNERLIVDIERAPEVHARQLGDAEKRMAELEEENFRLRRRLERVPPEVRLAMRVDE